MRKIWSIILLCNLLLFCFPYFAFATDVTSTITTVGQPFSKSAYARNVWDMQLFNNKIYLAHGDCVNTGGTTPLMVLNPSNDTFSTKFTIDDEQIDHFKVYDGVLYIPGMDATEDWNFGNYYTIYQNGAYEKHRTVPNANHVFDIAVYNGNVYTANSTGYSNYYNNSEVQKLDTSGNWITQMPTNLNYKAYDALSYTLFEYNGKLYSSSELFYLTSSVYNNLLEVDGNNYHQLVVGKQILASGSGYYHYKLARCDQFNGQLIYLVNKVANCIQWNADSMVKSNQIGVGTKIIFPNITAMPTDILIRDGVVYVLANIRNGTGYIDWTNVVYSSTDLINWDEIFSFNSTTFAKSFEEINGNFYIGMGCYVGAPSDISGTIYKVSNGSY